MQTMQFRGYRFVHNPQSITVRNAQRVLRHFCPGYGERVQPLGQERRVITCKGAFFGASYTEALAQLEALQATAAGRQAGLLFLPGHPPMTAHVSELIYEAQGDGCILPYTLVFTEGEESA